MHVPDGFFDAPTSIGAGAAAVGVLAVAVRKSAKEFTERLAPMAGLVSAFVFALQMLNFPVAGGTSGHLLGGALVAVLVRPWVGTICISVVLAVQALLFADGGLTAYGLNVILIAVVPSFVAYGLFRLLWRFLPKTRASVVGAGAVAAVVSVPVAAAVFAVLFAVGGAVDVPFTTVLGAMVGVHVLVGIGEAVITAAVLSAVVAIRPDLVAAAPELRANAAASSADSTKAPA